MAAWFDTHVHLERYASADRERLIAQAANAGVGGMLAVSTSRASSERTLELPAGIPKAIGIHPTKAAEGMWARLGDTADGRADVVAIGEAGFDDAGPEWAVQEAVFAAQVDVARELNLALILHIDGQEAWERLGRHGQMLAGMRVVRHYFRGDEAQIAWHAERGHWISFGRPILRDSPLQALACLVSADRLLIETDSYPMPGRTTEPKDLVEVGRKVAELRGWDLATAASTLSRNTATALRREVAGS